MWARPHRCDVLIIIHSLLLQYNKLELFTGTHENLALEAVLNDNIESVKCTTASKRGYYSSVIAGFTIGEILKPGACEHLGSLTKIKEDEDAIITEKKQRSKGPKSSKKTCTKKIVVKKKY